MSVFLSFRDYTRTHFASASRRRQTGVEPQHVCEPRIDHQMVYDDPDGRVFRVRRLRCEGCGQRWRDVREMEAAFALPTLRRGSTATALEANF